MVLDQLLIPEFTFCNVKVQSKKALFEFIADKANRISPDLKLQQVYNALINRERLGSTGIGSSVAIPHCRIQDSNQLVTLAITLESPIDFESPDDLGVKLVFALLAPEKTSEQHLELLSEIATLLSDATNRDQLLSSTSNQQLYQRIKDINQPISEQKKSS